MSRSHCPEEIDGAPARVSTGSEEDDGEKEKRWAIFWKGEEAWGKGNEHEDVPSETRIKLLLEL